jgi:hypothetical protein
MIKVYNQYDALHLLQTKAAKVLYINSVPLIYPFWELTDAAG